jgi:hypothetical protein
MDCCDFEMFFIQDLIPSQLLLQCSQPDQCGPNFIHCGNNALFLGYNLNHHQNHLRASAMTISVAQRKTLTDWGPWIGHQWSHLVKISD